MLREKCLAAIISSLLLLLPTHWLFASEQEVTVMTNVDDCDNASTVFFKSYTGLIGVASEIPTTDWPMPEKGDHLRGDFSRVGNVLVDYANKTGQVLLNIELIDQSGSEFKSIFDRFCKPPKL